MIQNSHVQYSDEWWEARRGLPTASQFKRIVKANGERSTQRAAYLYECAAVRITGIYKDSYASAAMDEGTAREVRASLHECRSGKEVVGEEQRTDQVGLRRSWSG